jgi:glycosyltransferase involved in cell wall biosynthesis
MIQQPFDSERFLEVGSLYEERRSRYPQDPVLGIVARLEAQKGHLYLLEAMPEVLKRFPSVQLLIVGNGPLEESLKTQARSLGISGNVFFQGEILVDEFPETLCFMDVFVYPSLYEGSPIAILEAMAMSLPVVASNNGGINESVVDGETGILVPPKTPHALAEALIKLLANKPLARQMGLEGRERVSTGRFQLSTYVKAIENLYEQLLA